MEKTRPPEIAGMLRGSYATPFGLARKAGEGWTYLIVAEDDDCDLAIEGALELRGFTAVLRPPESSVRVERGWLDKVSQSRPPFPLRIATWAFPDSLPEDERILELRPEDLERGNWESLVEDGDRSHYWSDRFDPDFYRAQATSGCIAIAMDRGDQVFLAPELQKEYAVLDWENLHRSRSLDRLFRSGKLESQGPRLVVNPDVEPVLAALRQRWKGQSWLHPEYMELMRALARDPKEDFRLWGVELRLGADGLLVAGELGYCVGRTYTSLTGFHDREKRDWKDLGKVQLHLLAALLQERGYAFWNLGQPYMQYKLDLGARILGRKEFLERWRLAIVGKDPGLNDGAWPIETKRRADAQPL